MSIHMSMLKNICLSSVSFLSVCTLLDSNALFRFNSSLVSSNLKCMINMLYSSNKIHSVICEIEIKFTFYQVISFIIINYNTFLNYTAKTRVLLNVLSFMNTIFTVIHRLEIFKNLQSDKHF